MVVDMRHVSLLSGGDGWRPALKVDDEWIGLEEWQFRRLKAMGVPVLTWEEAVGRSTGHGG